VKLLKVFEPINGASSMAHAGDLENAREVYISGLNGNLKFLLSRRFSWMNRYISSSDVGLELGSGIAASKDFIACQKFYTSDFTDSDWLDYPNIDALNTGFESGSFDFIIVSNVIHHLAYPKLFFEECYRLLKPSGVVLIQEIYTSALTRIILKLMKHEGFNEKIDVFDFNLPANNPRDAWSANCSIPKLLFSDKTTFSEKLSSWKILHFQRVECINFLNSGGVVAKTDYLPLSLGLLKMVELFDRFLIKMAPRVFAMQVQIVIRKEPGT
jgi:SAM-dependent methyltransferase